MRMFELLDDYADLMDVLQTLGIDVVAASRFVNSIRQKPKGTFLEMYGHGRMVIAAHGRRRALNLEGLGAFDLRTLKPDGTPWDFRLQADRDAARQFVLDK